jgi:hypothetical protein
MTTLRVTLPLQLDVLQREPGPVYKNRKIGINKADRWVIEIDGERLIRALGRKALKSKRHVTKLQMGAITIKPENVTFVPVEAAL